MEPSDVSAPWPATSRPRIRSIQAVVNAASGSVGPGAAAAMQRLFAEYGYAATVTSPEPSGIDVALRTAVAAAPDLVAVLAGDGTARQAAELCGPDGPLLAPLPGGTMNLLSKPLYGDRTWQEALAVALGEGVERMTPSGRIDGRAFYVAAILGAPALLGYVREAVRTGHLAKAMRRLRFALSRAFRNDLRYGLDDRPRRRTEALVLMSPMVSRAMPVDAALEAAALDVHTAREVFRLALNEAFGDWRRDPGVIVEPCVRGFAGARSAIPCILDGEVQWLPRWVEFAFEPDGFRALAAPGPTDAS
jgi:diacylglycerol kinase family enzyme